MSRRQIILTIALVFLLFSIAPASGEGGEHHFDWYGFWARIINSVILFGGLIYVLRKPLINFLSKKSIDVRNGIEQKEEESRKTGIELGDINKRLEKIEKEVNSLKDIARQEGETEQKRMEDLGRKESERIAAFTEEEINNKIEASIRKLKKKVSELAIERFKKEINTNLNDDLHNKIINDNIKISGKIIERK